MFFVTRSGCAETSDLDGGRPQQKAFSRCASVGFFAHCLRLQPAAPEKTRLCFLLLVPAAPKRVILMGGGHNKKPSAATHLWAFLRTAFACNRLRRSRLGCAQKSPGNRQGFLLVGMTRFELATPCTPCKCATGLRYIPMWFLFPVIAALSAAGMGSGLPLRGCKNKQSALIAL